MLRTSKGRTEEGGGRRERKMHMKQQNPLTNKQRSVPMAARRGNLTGGFPWLCLTAP